MKSKLGYRIWLGAGALLAILPIVVYLLYIYKFGINVVYWDDWIQVQLLNQFNKGALNLTELWQQHTDNRMLFPNIADVLIGSITHLNVKIEMYISFVLLLLSYVLAMAMIWPMTKKKWMLIPSSFIVFNLIQHENTLWGFQLAWFMVLFFSILALWLLSFTVRNEIVLPAALLASIVASYSLTQGLIIWPIGALYFLILAKGNPLPKNQFRRDLSIWSLTGLIAICVYLYHYNFHSTGSPSLYYSINHPLFSIKFYLACIGSVFSLQYPFNLVTGCCLFVVSIWVLIKTIAHGVNKGNAIPFLLIGYGLLYDALLLIGRSALGIGAAGISRYTTFNLILLLGVFWGIVLWLDSLSGRSQNKWRIDVLGNAVGVTCCIIVFVQYAFTLGGADAFGRSTRQQRIDAATVAVFHPRFPESIVPVFVYPDTGYFLKEVQGMKRNHLNVYYPAQLNHLMPELQDDYQVLSGNQSLLLKAADELNGGATMVKALRQLWFVYLSRPDLETAFPENSSSMAPSLLQWAVNSGTTVDGARQYIGEYREQYELAFYGYLAINVGGAKESKLRVVNQYTAHFETKLEVKDVLFLLLGIYTTRPDLQAAYSESSSRFLYELVNWAATSGIVSDSCSSILKPYAKTLIMMNTVK